MGAWGHHSFENDDALDWLDELVESSDFTAIQDALNQITDPKPEYLEAPDCSIALAAAETVAALRGQPAPSLPEELTDWLQGKPQPDPNLIQKAHRAVQNVLTDSELKELWDEAPDSPNQWIQSLTNLQARLQPNPG